MVTGSVDASLRDFDARAHRPCGYWTAGASAHRYCGSLQLRALASPPRLRPSKSRTHARGTSRFALSNAIHWLVVRAIGRLSGIGETGLRLADSPARGGLRRWAPIRFPLRCPVERPPQGLSARSKEKRLATAGASILEDADRKHSPRHTSVRRRRGAAAFLASFNCSGTFGRQGRSSFGIGSNVPPASVLA